MSAIAKEDPRVARSRAAVVDAARTLFLEKGYSGTTMEEIAAHAGIAKRTLYNNYADKGALFREIVAAVIAEAEWFARGVGQDLGTAVTSRDLGAALHDLGRRLALGILRPEVVALRRLLIGEAQSFPELAGDYFERAPRRVMDALGAWFESLDRAGLLRIGDARRAAEQFAYLVAGEPLDRAMLVGKVPSRERLVACAREGVLTFLARYGAEPESTVG